MRQLTAEVVRLVLSISHVELLPSRRILEQRQAAVGCRDGKIRRGVELRGAACAQPSREDDAPSASTVT